MEDTTVLSVSYTYIIILSLLPIADVADTPWQSSISQILFSDKVSWSLTQLSVSAVYGQFMPIMSLCSWSWCSWLVTAFLSILLAQLAVGLRKRIPPSLRLFQRVRGCKDFALLSLPLFFFAS